MQWYVKTLYKDITPHTTITQLKLLPLPEKYNKYLKDCKNQKQTLLKYENKSEQCI
jgi:hypothetical protein